MKDNSFNFDAKNLLDNAPISAGVYLMYNEDDCLIYVGKANNLKQRLSHYFQQTKQTKKTIILVSHIRRVDLMNTQSEAEALILEANMVREHQPRYNILLRDDKTFAYLHISDHKHPRLQMHRGKKRYKGHYYGPYPNTQSVKQTLQLLQNTIPIRQCTDSVYKNRARPCLLFQLNKCSAPCVKGHISEDDYATQVDMVKRILSGQDKQICDDLGMQMQEASQHLQFEKAAKLRDQLQAIRELQQQQSTELTQGNIDIIGIATHETHTAINVMMVRQGKLLGNQSYFPKIPLTLTHQAIGEQFVMQHYGTHDTHHVIDQLVINLDSRNDAIQQALSQHMQKKIALTHLPKTQKKELLEMAISNANTALSARLNDKTTLRQRWTDLMERFNLTTLERIECFDISHLQGEGTRGSCVVFDKEGAARSQYRRYRIEEVQAGDDYAAMEQAVFKRYHKQEDNDKVPDLILIDGGKGQLNAAWRALLPLIEQWAKTPLIIGVSKGISRKHGDETLLDLQGNVLNMPTHCFARQLIWHVRDESHNHAIMGSRNAVKKQRQKSTLEQLEGIGSKKRQALIIHFGGLQTIKKASIIQLMQVKGINRKLAHLIFDHFRHD
jgi:excinuclease ABC subunit C